MSETVPKDPYVYQPYGALDEPICTYDRLWGVGIPKANGGAWAIIKGLTSLEAHVVCDALRTLYEELEV